MIKKVTLIFAAVVLLGLKMNAQSFSYLVPGDGATKKNQLVAKSNGQVIFSAGLDGYLTFPSGKRLILKDVYINRNRKGFRVSEGSVDRKTYIIGELPTAKSESSGSAISSTLIIYAICTEGEKCTQRQELIDYVKLKGEEY